MNKVNVKKIITIDIGNTQIKTAIFEGDTIISTFDYESNKRSILKIINKLKSIRGTKTICYCSVVPELTKYIGEMNLKNYDCLPINVSTLKATKKIGKNFGLPSSLGADRKMNIFGCIAIQLKNFICIDFGTAITIDVVSSNKTYLGGIIAPGLNTSLMVLKEKTAQLPKVSLNDKKIDILSHSTVECIRSGVIKGTAFMCSGYIEKIQSHYGKKFTVIATGGHAKIIGRHSSSIARIEPHLTMTGIHWSILRESPAINS